MDKNLLIDYMLCRTTPEQEKAVLDWLDASPENRREMDSLDETFNAMVLHAPVAAANGASREYAWQEKAGGHAGAHADGNGTKKIWKVRRLVLRYAAVAAACAAPCFRGRLPLQFLEDFPVRGADPCAQFPSRADDKCHSPGRYQGLARGRFHARISSGIRL